MWSRYSTICPEDAWQEEDGTWTVTMSPWCEELITGIPTKELAYKILDVAHAAKDDYGRNCMVDE